MAHSFKIIRNWYVWRYFKFIFDLTISISVYIPFWVSCPSARTCLLVVATTEDNTYYVIPRYDVKSLQMGCLLIVKKDFLMPLSICNNILSVVVDAPLQGQFSDPIQHFPLSLWQIVQSYVQPNVTFWRLVTFSSSSL
jgi:hypothetical protein